MEMKKIACFSGAVAVALCVFADGSSCSHDFESAALGTTMWGDGTVAAVVPTQPVLVGYPLPSSDHAQVLEISGTVSNTLSWSSADTAQVDMMVRISRPEDALAALAEESAAAQTAIGVETNGNLCLWAKAKNSDTQSWLVVCPSNFVDETWLRISLNFNYAAGRMQLRVGGQPVVSANGYLTATSTDDSVAGSWYRMAANPVAGKSISQVSITGAAGLDDFVAQSGVLGVDDEAFPVDSSATVTAPGGIPVKVAYLNKFGLAWGSTASPAPDGSGMTVEKKYLLGLDPTDGSTFDMKDMGFVTVEGTEYVSIAIPGELADTDNYTYSVETATTADFASPAANAVTATDGKVKVALPASPSGTLYYRVKVVPKSGN